MTVKKILINFLGLVILLLIVYYGGTYLSELADKSYRKSIDKNGSVITAVVTKKKYLKGRYIVFSYQYKGIDYTNKQQDRKYYDNLYIGESIEIKIDTTNPEDSYIFSTGHTK